jgi:hypothetical protein
MNYLDRLFDDIEQRYGDAIGWTTLGQLAASLSASSTMSRPLLSDTTARRVASYQAA